MEKLRIVNKENECGGLNARLGHIVDLEALAAVCGRLNARLRIRKHVVEHTRGNTLRVFVCNGNHGFKYLMKSLPRFCGNENYGRIGHEGKRITDIICKLFNRRIVLFHDIPFIHDDNGSLAGFVRDTCYLFVLLRNALAAVYHNKANVGAFHRFVRAYNAVFFDFVNDLAFAAHTRRIYKREFAVFVFEMVVYRIARSTRHIGNDHSLLAEELVYNRAFACVRLTDNGYFNRIVILFLRLILAGRKLQNSIENIARARTVNRGNSNRVIETKLVKFVKSKRQITDGVYFVYTENYGLFASFKKLSDLSVVCGNTRIYVAKGR